MAIFFKLRRNYPNVINPGVQYKGNAFFKFEKNPIKAKLQDKLRLKVKLLKVDQKI